ncbi:uncharacterized protein LOC128882370 isoform X1 [Hylaeus volcanicus]|uniref:uncharacterized protein LOC128882370 isoform X1 n=1 Tax=Hylaeus volcanicus TaxID=313075 RepID=UPI0023B7BDA4|nr:uncharacterized protein LOC128882370 isoform X1 [Hylaeus volcanicus]
MESQGVTTYSSIVDNDIFIICSCTENGPCVYLENGKKEEAIEGDISSTSINRPSDICTNALQELHKNVDNMTDNRDICISDSQITVQNLIEDKFFTYSYLYFWFSFNSFSAFNLLPLINTV